MEIFLHSPIILHTERPQAGLQTRILLATRRHHYPLNAPCYPLNAPCCPELFLSLLIHSYVHFPDSIIMADLEVTDTHVVISEQV